MSDSLLQKPIGILGILGASIVGPYFFANKPNGQPMNASSQPAAMQPGGMQPAVNGNSGQSGFASSSYASTNYAAGDFAAGNFASSQHGPPPLGQLVAGQSVNSWSHQGSNTLPPNMPLAGVPMAGNSQMSNGIPSPFPSTTSGPLFDFREVLRFDMTLQSLMQKFPRITTVLSDTQLDGMRVPFVSGTMPTDVAGTLSYYFDRQQALRRVQMHGTMGEPSVLISLMTQYYNLKPEQTLGGYLYTTRWNNRVTSVLQLNLAPVIESSNQLSRYQVFLELNQPSMEYGISSEAQQILQAAQNAGRW